MSLGGLLVGRGLVTRADLDAALERQRAEGGRLGDNLVALGLLTAEELESVIHSTPSIPTAIAETGIPQRSLLNLLLKFMHLESCETVAELADRMKLPRGVIQVIAAVTAQAAPLAPKLFDAVIYLTDQEWVPLSNDSSSSSAVGSAPVELVAGGCGWGWHRRQWQDRWGYWHWGRCVPDEGRPYGGWGVGWYYPPSYWRGPSPPWGWGYP